ncbi:MAG: hypothetical protein WBX03_10085 [Terriglobales bacterium]|jgi:hypothetical protein
MGLGIVFIFWVIAGLVIAGVGALVLGGATAFLTRRVPGRRKLILTAGLFPFLCLAWAGAVFVFVFQAAVNEGLLNRDIGIGDTWHCPLLNGYSVMMIDDTDDGWLYNPKTQGPGGGVGEQEDAVAGVRLVQLAGPYLLGGADNRSFPERESRNEVNTYFLLGTRTGKRTNFTTYEALAAAARQLGIQPKLEPIFTIYGRYRFTWFEVFAGFLCGAPLLAGLGILGWWILRLRKRAMRSPQPA